MGAVEALLRRLRGARVYIDANFLIYFLDRTDTYFDLVAPIFLACDRGEFRGFTGDAAIAEVMVFPYRTKRPAEIARGKAFFARPEFLSVLSHDAATFDVAAQILASSNMRMIDALHYATALQAGCRYMLSNDRAVRSGDALDVVPITALVSD